VKDSPPVGYESSKVMSLITYFILPGTPVTSLDEPGFVIVNAIFLFPPYRYGDE
jgi:hypothetical protein